MSEPQSVTQIVACPRCGLRLVVNDDGHGLTLNYNIEEWHTKCCCVARGSPGLCCSFLEARKTIEQSLLRRKSA
jgi:hypothetical protein